MRFEKRSIFSGRPALISLVFYAAGVLLSTALSIGYLIPLALTGVALVAAVYFYLREAGRLSGCAGAALLISLGWFNAALSTGDFPPNHVASLAEIGGRVELTGKVVEEPDIRIDRTYLVVETDSVLIRGHRIPSGGRVRVRINDGGTRYDHADIIQFAGYLYKPGGSRNPGGFDYGGFLRTKDVFAAMSVAGPHQTVILEKGRSILADVIKPLRGYLLSRTNELLTPVSAAILSGFILGERREIPEEFQTLFRDTGTLHLMAVSGSNVALVIAVFAFPLAWLGLPRRVRIVFLLVVIIFFALLTRLEPSVVRASIMASIGLAAYGWIRKPDYINVLGFAGLVMLIWRPMQIYDIGLQLSFAATFAIIYTVSHLLGKLSFFRKRNLRWIMWLTGLSLSTVAAQVAVTPLLARYFNNVPLIGIIANIPVGILASLSSVVGIAFYFSTILGGWIANSLAGFLEVILDVIKDLLRFFSALPHASLKVPSPGWLQIFIFWSGLYFVFEGLIRRRTSPRGMIVTLSLLTLIIWTGLTENRPFWRVEFVDVGRNRALIFSDEFGKVVACYDCYKPLDDPFRTMTRHILNYYGGKLDFLFTSTPDAAAVLEIIDLFSPVLISADELRSASARAGTAGLDGGYDLPEHRLPASIKVVWEKSDNKEEEKKGFPTLQIDVGEEALLFAAWSNTGLPAGYQADKNIRLLEMPWGIYAQSSCRRQIESLDPGILVFSPDRLTVGAPGERSELTYRENETYSTSICGGLVVEDFGSVMKIRTMRPITIGQEGMN